MCTLRTAKGSGGADRWHASELRHLPVPAIARFRDLMLSFEAEGVCPRQLSECRMVVLAKPNKVTQGCTAAADTRPISIFSCFYRSWLTAWVRTPCMRKWLQTHMPAHVCIGQGSEAQLTAGLLLNSISERVFGATLDYSKCYDSMDPRGTLALMQLAGLACFALRFLQGGVDHSGQARRVGGVCSP